MDKEKLKELRRACELLGYSYAMVVVGHMIQEMPDSEWKTKLQVQLIALPPYKPTI